MIKNNLKAIPVLIFSVLLIMTIFFAIKSSSQGAKLAKLESEESQLAEVNQDLKSKIVNTTSLSEVSKEAEKSGMKEPQKFVYMNQTGVAMRGANQVASAQ